jgi:hypothetical protein
MLRSIDMVVPAALKELEMENHAIEKRGAPSALKMTLGDVLLFIKWMNEAEKALDRAEAFPAIPPELDNGTVGMWVQIIHGFEKRFRRSEEWTVALEASVMAQEAKMGELLSHLHVNIASLYDNLGQSQRAEEMRRRAQALRSS